MANSDSIILGATHDRGVVKGVISLIPIHRRHEVICVEYYKDGTYQTRMYNYYTAIIKDKAVGPTVSSPKKGGYNEVKFDVDATFEIKNMIFSINPKVFDYMHDYACMGKLLEIPFREIKTEFEKLREIIKTSEL